MYQEVAHDRSLQRMRDQHATEREEMLERQHVFMTSLQGELKVVQ